MVTEYIKRKQRMGFDENGKLVYKVPMDQPSPLADYNTEEVLLVEDDEDMPPLNLV
jgi:hypothetical protein